MKNVVQDDCGCVYAVGEHGRIPAFRCPVHGGDDASRPLLASDAVSILPWDAALFLAMLLERLHRQLPDGPLDAAVLGDVYEAVEATSRDVGPLDRIVAMLARSAILTATDAGWRFTHRWHFDQAANDYIRG
jgi:hypothetical protein